MCFQVTSEIIKNDDDIAAVQCRVQSTEPCCFKACKRPAKTPAEYDNLGSELVLGDDKASWNLQTRQHAKGYVAICDRMTYDENPQIGGVAPLKMGISLTKTIRVHKDTLRKVT